MSCWAGLVVSTVKDLPVFCVVTERFCEVLVRGVIKIVDWLETAVVSMVIEMSPSFRIPVPNEADATSGVSMFIFLVVISPLVLISPFSAMVTFPSSRSRP